MKNERPGIFTGIIKSINDNNFIYESNSCQVNCGGIIINPNSNSIIGMHIGDKNNGKKTNILNIGNFMFNIIEDINNIIRSKKNKKIKTNNCMNNINKNNFENYTLDEENNYFKILLGGDTISGKTTYFNQLLYNKYDDRITSSITCNYKEINLIIKNTKIYYNLWDTYRWAGQFDGLVKIFLKGTKGILLLFSLSYKSSFNNLDHCIRIMEEASLDLSNVPILLLGTGADIKKREVESKEAIEYSKKHKFIGYYEVSSKTGQNVKEAFQFLGNSVYQINVGKKN